MSSTNTYSDQTALFKQLYADKVVNLVPENLHYCNEIKPMPADKQPGNKFNQPVVLSMEEGVTLSPPENGAYALNSPIANVTANAQVQGSQFTLRSAIDYESLFRSKNNKGAFVQATKHVIESALKSAYFYKEAEMMWGKRGVGIVDSASDTVVTIKTAEYASGLWSASKNRSLRFMVGATAVARGTASVESYSISDRTITLDAAVTGLADGDYIYFGSAGLAGANEMEGIYNIIDSTNASVFGISGSTHDLWLPAEVYDLESTELTFQKIMKAVSRGANKGMGDGITDIDVVVNPLTYQDLLNEAAGARSQDSSYRSELYENGSSKAKFHCAAGTINLTSHRLMKEGYAFVHPKASKFFDFIGCQATPTFNLPGFVKNGEQQYLKPMSDNAGYETRLYWNGAVFTPLRNQTILIKGIVNTAS